MKKILSIFLISAMMISMFAGVTAFAATSQATGDGGTLWHKWDFENDSIADKLANATYTGANLEPVISSDASGRNYGKFTVTASPKAETYLFYTSSTLQNSTERYAIIEYDFKKDNTEYDASGNKSTSSNVYFYIRDSRVNASNNGYNTTIYSYDKAEIADWTHYAFVIDRQDDSDGKYTVNVYTRTNDTYALLETKEIEDRAFNHFRFYMSGASNTGKSFYMDNLEFMSYGDFYTAINSASSVQNAVDIINRYSVLGMSGLSSDFYNLAAEDKTTVASKLLNKNFESDAAAISALSAAMSDLVVVKKYFDWDFEDGTLNDSVNNEPFMAEHPSSDKDGVRMVVDKDPTNSSNTVAKMNFSTAGDRYGENTITYTTVIDDARSKGEFNYLVFDFKVYGATTKSTVPIYMDTRNSAQDSTSRFQPISTNLSSNTWHQIKIVMDTDSLKSKAYELRDNEWILIDTNSIQENSGFYRIEFSRAGETFVAYYDDFKVTGYNDVIAEITEASADGVANVLEVYDEIGIVELPASYASLDAAGKTALGTYIKANTTASTTVAALNEAITLYLSNDELVVLSADATSTALNGLKLAVKKDGVSLASANLIIAAYDGTELVSVKVCDVDTAVSNGTVIEKSSLAFDISSADSVKLMLVNNIQAMTPAVKATALK